MDQLALAFTPEKLEEAWHVFLTEFPLGLWETVYVTLLSTLFAIVLGMPLGILLVTGDEKGIHPLPKPLMKALNIIINFLRSVPFLILMVMVIPLTRFIMGTSLGSVASIVPLVVAAFPFVARLVESSLRELDPNIIEMAQSMGSSTMQIITRVMLPESVPSLVTNFTLAITTILGYTAMSGAMGGGMRFSREGGWAWICPDEGRGAFRVVAEAASEEYARELCDFCESELKRIAGKNNGLSCNAR